jgi:hypothetical protein
MFALLDPRLFHAKDAAWPGPIAENALEDLVWMLSRSGAIIPDERDYWRAFASQPLRAISASMRGRSRYLHLLDRLRERAVSTRLAPLPSDTVEIAGFDPLFVALDEEWRARMKRVLVRCAHTSATILVTRLQLGCNARAHDHDGRIALVEKLCWELVVRSGDRAHAIPCVCSSRNLRLSWTCRYADELPAHEDGAAFPFCPPDDWRDPARLAIRTRKARPTWADKIDHHWAEPAAQQATGASYHWDVYLSAPSAAEYGLDQLNIARFRSTATRDGEPPPGALHHVPEEKKSKLRKITGWSCE